MISRGDSFEARLVECRFDVTNTGDYGSMRGGEQIFERKVDGSIYATFEILIPNRRISGDVRHVRQTVHLVNIRPFPVEPGDGDAA